MRAAKAAGARQAFLRRSWTTQGCVPQLTCSVLESSLTKLWWLTKRVLDSSSSSSKPSVTPWLVVCTSSSSSTRTAHTHRATRGKPGPSPQGHRHVPATTHRHHKPYILRHRAGGRALDLFCCATLALSHSSRQHSDPYLDPVLTSILFRISFSPSPLLAARRSF